MTAPTNDLCLVDVLTVSVTFGLKTTFIRRLIFEKKIPFYKVGRRVLFRLSEIEIWLDSKKTNLEFTWK